MESETAVFKPQFVEIDDDLHEHGGPKRKVSLVEANDPAVGDIFQLETDIAGGVIELRKLENSVRQIGERFPRSSIGEPGEMALADRFEASTNVGLLVEIVEGPRFMYPKNAPILACSSKSWRSE